MRIAGEEQLRGAVVDSEAERTCPTHIWALRATVSLRSYTCQVE